MPTCPKCEGKGKWHRLGNAVECSVCYGVGTVTGDVFTGYTARKVLETKLDLEEIADPSPENVRRVQSIRRQLQKNMARWSWVDISEGQRGETIAGNLGRDIVWLTSIFLFFLGSFEGLFGAPKALTVATMTVAVVLAIATLYSLRGSIKELFIRK